MKPVEQRREKRRDEARRAILDATEALLLEEGYEGFSMRRLAARCGYTVPTLYHHFRDKPGLLDALLEERLQRLVSAIRRAGRSDDPARNAREMARALVRFGLRHPTHYRLLSMPRLKDAEPLPAEEEGRALFEAPIRALAETGRLRVDDVELAVQILWSFSHGLISVQTSRPDYDWLRALNDTAVDVMLNGLLRPLEGNLES